LSNKYTIVHLLDKYKKILQSHGTYITILKITCLYLLDVFFMPHKLLNSHLSIPTHAQLNITG